MFFDCTNSTSWQPSTCRTDSTVSWQKLKLLIITINVITVNITINIITVDVLQLKLIVSIPQHIKFFNNYLSSPRANFSQQMYAVSLAQYQSLPFNSLYSSSRTLLGFKDYYSTDCRSHIYLDKNCQYFLENEKNGYRNSTHIKEVHNEIYNITYIMKHKKNPHLFKNPSQ